MSTTKSLVCGGPNKELRLLGVHEALIPWISAFLLNRTERVKIGNSVSCAVSPPGGIPQGTKLAPLLFAILVNRLVDDWNNRMKYVDDLTIFEIIPRNSVSYLPIIADDFRIYASQRRMKLNAKKCKEMFFDFLKYKSTCPSPLVLGGAVIERVTVKTRV